MSVPAQQRYAASLRRQRQQVADTAAAGRHEVYEVVVTARAKQDDAEARWKRQLSERQQQQGEERSRVRQRQVATLRAEYDLGVASRLCEAEAGRDTDTQRELAAQQAERAAHEALRRYASRECTSLTCVLAELAAADAALGAATERCAAEAARATSAELDLANELRASELSAVDEARGALSYMYREEPACRSGRGERRPVKDGRHIYVYGGAGQFV